MASPESSPRSHAGFSAETLAAAGFPPISYDTLVVGESFRSDERLIRPQDVEAYAYAVDDHDPWFFEPGPWGGPIAHPTLLANQALFLRHNRYVVPAGLHTRMVFDFVGSIPLGTRARTTGQVLDKYVRRDKPYMVTGYETAAEDGRVLVRGHFVQMLFRAETAPPAGSGPRPEPEPPAVDPAVRSAPGRSGTLGVGQRLGPVARTLEQRQIDIYSGVKPGSIHTDESWARAKGFPTTIAQGMMSTAYVSALMTAALGAGFVEGGRMDVRFLRPVLRGDRLVVSGEVVGFERDGGQLRAHLEVAVHNQDGAQTLGGTASGLVP
ncbi:MAG: MaoC/PaaZ C-terminal domain-containing protein [Acidimicrobiia bacterium]|nr:MaoC/PaaZ C-terminal domain-containing protein [Acidimicrobiia bacterium]